MVKAQVTVEYDGSQDPRYVDYTVPSGKSGQYLYFSLKGGDGGNETEDQGHSGGVGATVKGFLKIGTGSNEVPEGATLRFIPGQHGATWGKRGGGGGGTAVAYQKSDGSWVLLMVAGGGGGAGNWVDGRPGTTTTSGTNGTNGITGNGINNKGVDGEGGGADEDGEISGSGGGAGSNASCCSSWNGKAGIVDDVPTGSDGGNGGQAWGGFGFGSGGAAYKDAAIVTGTYYSGGGGGGYSGGGGGKSNGAGGGAGSYANDAYVLNAMMQSNGVTQTASDGYVEYQYTSGLVQPGTKQVHFKKYISKCVEIENGATSNGANIQIANCETSAAQQWELDDSYLRMLSDPDKCLDLTSSNTASGTNIQLWDCNQSNAQKWIYDVNNQFIRSQVNGSKCIALVNGITTSGNNIQLYDCKYNQYQSNMQWIVDDVSTTTLDGEQLRMHFAKDPSKCLNFEHAATTNGTNISLYNCHSTDSQYLFFDGEQIKMYSSEKCVDVKSGSTSNGANVQLYTCNNSDAQQWIYDGFTQTFRFRKDMSKCLDVKGGSTDNSTNIQLWNCNGSDAQEWRVYK